MFVIGSVNVVGKVLGANLVMGLANAVGNFFGMSLVISLLAGLGRFLLVNCYVVGKSFGVTVLIQLLTGLCPFYCLLGYRLSHRGVVDGKFDSRFGRRGRQVFWYDTCYQFVKPAVPGWLLAWLFV